MVENERIKYLKKHPVVDGKYVLYRLQAAWRAELNRALEYAVGQTNVTKKPLIIRRIIEAIER